jgi:hypothetical protein
VSISRKLDKIVDKLDIVLYQCLLSAWEHHEFEANMGNIVRPCLPK